MSNVQLEHGYTRIANELLEALARTPLNGTQWRILLVVFRVTYGYNRKSTELSESYIAKATGIHRKQVNREINPLISYGVLIVKRQATFNSPRVIAFNKNYEQWNVSTKTLTVNKTDTPNKKVDTTGNGLVDTTVNESVDHKRKKKNNIKKNTAYPSDFEKFYAEYPRPEGKRRTYNNWRTCLKTYSVEQLMAACSNYKSTKAGTEKQFLKTSANFLGREKPFEDYLPENYQEQQEQKENYGVNLPPHEKYFD